MNLRHRWASSTLLRVASVLGAVTLLAAAVVLTAAFFTEQSTGKGAAINIAGSLRMQSYLLATRVADQRGAVEGQRLAVAGEIAGFERRFTDPRLVEAIPVDGALRQAYQRIEREWAELKPLAIAAVDSNTVRDEYLDRVHTFVAGIDRFVLALEDDLESRIHSLQVALGAALFVILVLVVTAFFVLDIQVFQPIKDLVRVTQSVRRGEFGVRAEATGNDELGQLGRDFNHMVEELGRLYGSLEAQIATKTADLAEKNRSLSLLYETARELSTHSLTQSTLTRIADKAREVLGVQGAVICARHQDAAVGLPLAAAEESAGSICGVVRCAGCRDEAKVVWHDGPIDGQQRRVVSVPIVDGERMFGVMPLMLAPGQTLAPWQLELAQTVGRHLGAALSAAEARDEHRRLALLEERSAIARELHDSLAQSLSYTKIQLTRLSVLLAGQDGQPSAVQAREVVQELREGVSTAYRQLRELLTTFRLQLNGKGLASALQDAAADFTARCDVPVDLDNQLLGVELSANEQIHVLQIVREALSNVEHHARASRVRVQLRRVSGAGGSEIEVVVEDDGVGIATQASPRHHFGLSIMRDRAHMLNGQVQIEQREPGAEKPGTRVSLRFPSLPYGRPESARAAPVPPSSQSKDRVPA